MANLIYTTAFGKPYYISLAVELYRSVRKHGYTGDFIVLTDDIELPEVEGLRFFRTQTKYLWKTAILDIGINLEKYDKILFLDSDIVCIAPIDELFALEGIHIAMEDWDLSSNAMNSQFLSLAEKQRAKAGKLLSVNAGTFVFPGVLAKKFLGMWREVFAQCSKKELPDLWNGAHADKDGDKVLEWWDQGALQALCMRDLPWKPLPKAIVNMPAMEWKSRKLTEKTALIHFNGLLQTEYNKKKVLEWMRQINGDSESVAAICEEACFVTEAAIEARAKAQMAADRTVMTMLEGFESAIKKVLENQAKLDRRIKRLESLGMPEGVELMDQLNGHSAI